MKIVALSDTHRQHWDIIVPKGDVLVYAGDAEIDSPIALYDFVEWMSALPHKHKIYVPGNHDRHNEAESLISSRLFEEKGIRYLNGTYSITLPNKLKIAGTAMQPYFNNWAFNEPQSKVRRSHFDSIERDIDLLITHCPPFGILDKNDHGQNCGDPALSRSITEKPFFNLKYHIFGHIHNSQGIDGIYVNCSVLDDCYDLKFDPKVLNI